MLSSGVRSVHCIPEHDGTQDYVGTGHLELKCSQASAMATAPRSMQAYGTRSTWASTHAVALGPAGSDPEQRKLSPDTRRAESYGNVPVKALWVLFLIRGFIPHLPSID